MQCKVGFLSPALNSLLLTKGMAEPKTKLSLSKCIAISNISTSEINHESQMLFT